MDAERAPAGIDRIIAALAARQHGVVARRQLAAAGIGRGAVETRVRAGRLHRLHRGVYAVGHTVLTVEGRWMAAVLACGPGAVLSHRSAAALWRIGPREAGPVEVTVPTHAGRRARAGIAVHRSAALAPEEITEEARIPVTTVARTLPDVAGARGERAVGWALEEVERRRLCEQAALDAVLARHPNHPGTAVLRRARDHGGGLTRSELERRFLAVCRSAGVPAPRVNAALHGYEVDFLWQEARLVVETDGHRFHGTRAAFERDRARDAVLTLAGYRVVRFTHRQVAGDPAAVAWTLRGLLSLAR